jgi:hypothetical protein
MMAEHLRRRADGLTKAGQSADAVCLLELADLLSEM